jgi:hypothetical protein
MVPFLNRWMQGAPKMRVSSMPAWGAAVMGWYRAMKTAMTEISSMMMPVAVIVALRSAVMGFGERTSRMRRRRATRPAMMATVTMEMPAPRTARRLAAVMASCGRA